MKTGAGLPTVLLALSTLAGSALAVPTPWSETLLDDINSMRARGMSEDEIASRFPRYLSIPSIKILTESPQYPTIHELYPTGAEDVFIVDEDEVATSSLRRLLNGLTSWIGMKSASNNRANYDTVVQKLPMTYSRALKATHNDEPAAQVEVK